MSHRESWSVTNYGSRGPRGKTGRGISYLEVDSEGELWAYYTDETNQDIGPMPQGLPGEPGQNGKVVDVLVNGATVVNSEGIAAIEVNPGEIYEAGENIQITGNIISATDTKYTAGDNIEISASNVISSPMLIDKALTVGLDIGGYYKDDVIPANTPIRDIIEKLLCPEAPPVPPVTDMLYWGVGGDRRNPPVGILSTFTPVSIDPQEIERYGYTVHYNAQTQWTVLAYPATMPDLTYAEANDTGVNALDAWQKTTTEYQGVSYKYYYSGPIKSNDTKWVFKWR